MNRTYVPGTIAALSLLGTAAWLSAGPLSPPAGPVASTNKTLAEVEPRIIINSLNTPGDADSLYRITKPGSYYLTGNITGVAGKHGIEIDSHGVTLDLNGFELLGIAAMGAFDGIYISPLDGLDITIRNGSVRGWGDCGIEFDHNGGHPASGCLVERVHAGANVRCGIQLWSAMAAVNCTAVENGDTGIDTLADCILTACNAYFNGAHGFNTNTSCSLSGCVASNNAGDGFSLAFGCTITGCTASNNALSGIAGSALTVHACAASLNTGVGIDVGSGSIVSGCSAYNNESHGFSIAGSAITNCTASANTADGIILNSDCLATGNTCDGNGSGTGNGAGIAATGNDNRIEGNKCTDADRGIDITGSGNILIRNACSGNTTNWTIAAGNSFGPIVVVNVSLVAVNGNAAASTLTTTDANANFTY